MKSILPLFLLVGFVIFSAAGLFAQEERNAAEKTQSRRQTVADSSAKVKKFPSPRGALWRALVFPGWGQWYNEKKWKAALVFVAETGLIANAVYWNQRAQGAINSYDRAFYVDNRNLSNWWLLFTVFMSATDAYVDAQLANFDVSPDLSARPGAVAVGLRFSLR